MTEQSQPNEEDQRILDELRRFSAEVEKSPETHPRHNYPPGLDPNGVPYPVNKDDRE